jgi:hypothetical protein
LLAGLFSVFLLYGSSIPGICGRILEDNGVELSELIPENVVVFAGNTMENSKMGFLKNFYYLTEDDLDDLRDADSGSEAYTHFGEEAWISNDLYSSSDDHAVQEWRYSCFTGIDLEKAFTGLGVETTPSTSLRVKSTDGTTYTLQNAFDQSRYYFNPQGEQSAEPVVPILVLKRSVESTMDAPNSESTLEVPQTAANEYQPLFAYGQINANEDNNCHFVKTVNSVVAGTEDVALTIKQDGKSDIMMSISEIVRQGVYKTEYTFKSSGSTDFRTHDVTGIPLTRLLDAMGVSVANGQSIQPATSDNYSASAIVFSDMDKWFVAYDAQENGSQVNNDDPTALRLYGPGQFGNQMIVKNLTTLTVTGEVTVDKTELTDAISAANTKHDNAIEGTAAGQYAAGSKAAFKAAIDAAQAVVDDSEATQEEVDQAVIDLASAKAIFDAAKTTGSKEEGGDVEDAVFYIAVKESAGSDTKYYYYTRDELEGYENTEDFLYNDHSVIKTVTAKGALLSDLLSDLDGVTITGDMIIQYAESDGYHADQNTAIENSSYKDKVEWLTASHFNGSTTIAPAKTMITYGIHEEYETPDENNVNDPAGVFKDEDNGSGYLRAYRETGSGQNDANIGGANATVIKYLMGVIVSYDGAQFSGQDGYTLKAVSDKNPDLAIVADQKVTGLMPGMQFAVKAPSVVNSVLASGEAAYQMITVGTGASETITFKYTENPYFYVTKGDTVNYTYTDLVKVSVQVPDKNTNTAPYGYSRPMYYRYNGVWLADLIGTEIMNDSSVTGFTIKAKDGSAETKISKEDVAKYFVAYNNTQSKTSTNIPEGKRVTITYQDAKIIIPGEGENITGSATNDYTSAGKDVGVLVAEAEGIAATLKSSGSSGGGGGGSVVPSASSDSDSDSDAVTVGEDSVDKEIRTEGGKTIETFTIKTEVSDQLNKANKEGKTVVEIEVPASQDATTIIQVSNEILERTEGMAIGITAKDVKLEIPENLIKTLVEYGQDLNITIESATVSEASAELSGAEGTEGAKVLGTPIHINNDIKGSSKVTLPLKGISIPSNATEQKAFLDSLAIFAVHSDNTKEIIKPSIVYDEDNNPIGIQFAVDRFSLFAVIQTTQPAVRLTDISGHWAEANIQKLVVTGAIAGYPDKTFKPNNSITRAEFVSILVRAFNLEPKTGKVFDDTDNSWAKDSIATANAYGIINGYSDTRFGPDDLITREQMAVMVVKAAKIAASNAELTFEDQNSISSWARDAVSSAVSAGLVSGYPDQTFKPQNNATRAEAVAVITRAMEKNQ